jgi:hypothetical protein
MLVLPREPPGPSRRKGQAVTVASQIELLCLLILLNQFGGQSGNFLEQLISLFNSEHLP